MTDNPQQPPAHWPQALKDAFWTAVNAPTYDESATATLTFAQLLTAAAPASPPADQPSLDERVRAAVHDAVTTAAQNPHAGRGLVVSLITNAVLAEVHRQTTGRAALRARIAEALMQWAESNNSPQYGAMRRPATVVQTAYSRADAVLAVLPSSGCLTPEYTDGPCHCPACDPAAHRTDRSAVLADVERAIRTATGSCGYKADDGCDFCNGVDAALDQIGRAHV